MGGKISLCGHRDDGALSVNDSEAGTVKNEGNFKGSLAVLHRWWRFFATESSADNRKECHIHK